MSHGEQLARCAVIVPAEPDDPGSADCIEGPLSHEAEGVSPQPPAASQRTPA